MSTRKTLARQNVLHAKTVLRSLTLVFVRSRMAQQQLRLVEQVVGYNIQQINEYFTSWVYN
jgi:hypothetical protein